MKRNRFLKLIGCAKHIRFRTLHQRNPRMDDIFDLKSLLRNFVLCWILKWSASRIFLFSNMIIQVEWTSLILRSWELQTLNAFFHKRDRKSAVISNTFLPEGGIGKLQSFTFSRAKVGKILTPLKKWAGERRDVPVKGTVGKVYGTGGKVYEDCCSGGGGWVYT